jgi:hypothetical protein
MFLQEVKSGSFGTARELETFSNPSAVYFARSFAAPAKRDCSPNCNTQKEDSDKESIQTQPPRESPQEIRQNRQAYEKAKKA